MRFGQSWPAGRGRRRWVSSGPWGCLVAVLLVLAVLGALSDAVAAVLRAF